jgi:WD40 repeat protein
MRKWAVIVVLAGLAMMAGCGNAPQPATSPLPSSTPAPTTTPTPTSAPTPSLSVLAGTPVPMPQEPITPENAADIVELAMWGKGWVLEVTYSPDGRLLAVGTSTGIWLHDAQTLDMVRFIETDGGAVSLAFTPDSGMVFAKSGEEIAWWNVASGERLGSLEVGQGAEVAFFLDGARLAAVSNDRRIELRDLERGERLRVLEGHNDRVSGLAFSPDGSLLAAVTVRGGKLWLWDVRSGDPLDIAGELRVASSLAFSHDGTTLAVKYDGAIHLWDVRTWVHLQTLEVGGYTGVAYTGVESLAFSPDGSLLAAACDDGMVRLWDVRTGALLRTLDGDIENVTFSRAGTTLAAVELGGETVRLWDVETGALLGTLQGYGSISGLAVSPDGTVFVSYFSFHDGGIETWDIRTGQIVRTLEATRTTHIALSADGTTLAAAMEDAIMVWDTATGQRLQAFARSSDAWPPLTGLALSPDGRMLACASRGSGVAYDVRTGEVLGLFGGGDGSQVVFSPDGDWLAEADWDFGVSLLNARTGELELVHELEVPGHYLGGLAFSPDGEMLATGSYDNDAIWLWDVETEEIVRSLEGHTDNLRTVVFSPDGTLLASSAEDGTTRLWDVRTGRSLWTLNTCAPYFIAFSSDGSLLLLDCAAVQLWGVPPD